MSNLQRLDDGRVCWICDGSIRDLSTNPLEKSLGYQFALFTTKPSEEENRDIHINLLLKSRSFLARIESRRGNKPDSGEIVNEGIIIELL
ncbi:hypothetical protein TNCV_3629941 [Trichonephila clavipes]|nr:hypothetical protein TNCV_3629941 [Trichonephila clavipes]